MASFRPVAGSRIDIGPAMEPIPDEDIAVSDFTAFDSDWVEIDGWQQVGQLGDSKNQITENLVNRGRDEMVGGTFAGQTMSNIFDILRNDAGQAALRAAFRTKCNYAFRVRWSDEACGVSPDPGPRIQYFAAEVGTLLEAGGTANTPQRVQADLWVNTRVVDGDEA